MALGEPDINYVVTYDSAYTIESDGSVSGTPTILPIISIDFGRNIAPSDDSATITIAGIYAVSSAREVYFYRINADGSYTLKFRGMTTDPTYTVASGGNTTVVEVNPLWYELGIRLFQVAGKSPPPLQPNTNPYLVYLNPLLNLDFGILWGLILQNAFAGSYSTGHLPPLRLANTMGSGEVNTLIAQFTDFDNVVVNDQMNIQYQSISATVDRLVQSALFSSSDDQPFLAEYRMDIGDFPFPYAYPTDTNLYAPHYPTATVMLFDPIHSILGNGQNRTGTTLGDGSIFTTPDGTAAGGAGQSPNPNNPFASTGYFPMCYVEFGVVDGYKPVDTIIYSEGDNIVSIVVTNQYTAMNNSWVLTGGSFQGSDVVALPINNQRSIAEFGLKQTNTSLQNVVDQAEIKRYVGTSISFFQHPIPNIILTPDYVYASSHVLYPGDYITVNAPSLSKSNPNGEYPIEDSNGQPLGPVFTARVKTIQISWNPQDGESITLTLTFPVFNLPLEDWPTSLQNSNAGAIQFLYSTVQPTPMTVIGKDRNQSGSGQYQAGEDFITSRTSPYVETVHDGSPVLPSGYTAATPLIVSISAQVIESAISAIDSTGQQVLGDNPLIYQFLTEVDVTTGSNIENVWMTVLQPDGMAVFDTPIDIGQQTNILSLLSLNHANPPFVGASAPLVSDLSGDYVILLRNTAAHFFLPYPLFATNIPAPTAVPTLPFLSEPIVYYFVYCPVDSNGDEFGISFMTPVQTDLSFVSVTLSWPAVPGASSYNVYVASNPGPAVEIQQHPPMAGWSAFPQTPYTWVANKTGLTYTFTGSSGTTSTQPYAPAVGFAGAASSPTYFTYEHYYWYLITAINPDGSEVWASGAGGPTLSGEYSPPASASGLVGDGYHLPSVQFQPSSPNNIEVSWPQIPFAAGYNVYRADAGTSNTKVPDILSFKQITSISDPTQTVLLDDGMSYPINSTTPPTKPTPSPENVTYSVYLSYSYLPVASQTQTASSQANNPSTATIYDPTLQRVYLPHSYVAI